VVSVHPRPHQGGSGITNEGLDAYFSSERAGGKGANWVTEGGAEALKKRKFGAWSTLQTEEKDLNSDYCGNTRSKGALGGGGKGGELRKHGVRVTRLGAAKRSNLTPLVSS